MCRNLTYRACTILLLVVGEDFQHYVGMLHREVADVPVALNGTNEKSLVGHCLYPLFYKMQGKCLRSLKILLKEVYLQFSVPGIGIGI